MSQFTDTKSNEGEPSMLSEGPKLSLLDTRKSLANRLRSQAL